MSKVIAAMQSGQLPMPTTEPAAMTEGWLAEAAARQRDCKHEDLQFGSGGFYVMCCQCGAMWVARLLGNKDTEIDYQRSNNLVSTSDHRTPALSRPAADRGQIVEECARAADRAADLQFDDRALEQFAREIASEIRVLSPAPAQTEE